MKEQKMTVYAKEGKAMRECWTSTDSVEVLHRLSADLAAKYCGKAAYVKRIERRNNYDGTQTYTVTYASGDRVVYVTDIY